MPSCFTAKGHTLSFHYLNSVSQKMNQFKNLSYKPNFTISLVNHSFIIYNSYSVHSGF